VFEKKIKSKTELFQDCAKKNENTGNNTSTKYFGVVGGDAFATNTQALRGTPHDKPSIRAHRR
jgi:hypothetical protein